MPSEALDVAHGRRGGRSLPSKPAKEADPAELAAARARVDAARRAGRCLGCKGPKHETAGEYGACMEAKARLAEAKKAAGGVLDHAERESLRMFPEPRVLTFDRGYDRVPG